MIDQLHDKRLHCGGHRTGEHSIVKADPGRLGDTAHGREVFKWYSGNPGRLTGVAAALPRTAARAVIDDQFPKRS